MSERAASKMQLESWFVEMCVATAVVVVFTLTLLGREDGSNQGEPGAYSIADSLTILVAFFPC